MIRNIKSLQVFEEAARCQHVSQAARNLGISQSAVSYHIRKLEDDLAIQLFDRSSGGFELMPHGALLADHMRKGLAEMDRGIAKVRGIRHPSEIRVSVVSMFASRRLSGRLGHFWEAHPGIQISFASYANLPRTVDALDRDLDLAVRWGHDGFGRCQATELFRDNLIVVCSPDFLRRYPIRSEADVDKCPLLHVDDHGMWAEWFRNVRGSHIKGESQMLLEDRGFQLGSTVNGLGLSLFVESFIRDDLEAGTLINPLGRSYPTSFAYHLLTSETGPRSDAAEIFHGWMLDHCGSRRSPAEP